jgi:hypothetical protein
MEEIACFGFLMKAEKPVQCFKPLTTLRMSGLFSPFIYFKD